MPSSTLTTKLPYKEAKELFVSQLQGGSVYKINVVSLTALTTYTFWACLRSRALFYNYNAASRSVKSSWTGSALQAWLLEFSILVVPIVFAVTVLSDYLAILNGGLILACMYILRTYPAPSNSKRGLKSHKRHWSKPDSDEDDRDDAEVIFGGTPPSLSGLLADDEHPLRISVDSAADHALASAAPPTQFVPPGVDDSSYSSHSSRLSSEDAGQGPADRTLPLPTSKTGRTLMASGSPLRYSATSPHFATSSASQSDPSDQSNHLSSGYLRQPQQSKNSASMKYVPRNQPYLSVYRAHMMLMTIICILAVDFQAFPREFAKCETWGTSLVSGGPMCGS
jgi:phosphatidylinositol glycan class W